MRLDQFLFTYVLGCTMVWVGVTANKKAMILLIAADYLLLCALCVVHAAKTRS